MPRLWDLRLQWDCRISLYYAQWQYSIYPYIRVFRKQALSNKHSSTYFNMRQNSRKRDVHSFHCVWQLYIVTPPEQEKKKKQDQNKLQVHEKVQIQSRAHQKPAYFLAICSMLYPGLGSLEICGDTLCYKHVMTHWQKLVPWIQIAALLSKTTAPTFITRANLSKQFPTAMSIVSPNILYRRSE